MKCAIYGAGSLGTVLGAYMTKNGAEVELVYSAPESQCESLGGALRDLTAGSVEVSYGGTVFRGSLVEN